MSLNLVRQAIVDGNFSEAFRLLKNHVQTAQPVQGALRYVQVLETRFNLLRQHERKGLLDFNESQKAFNRLADDLLGLIDDLEAGRPIQTPEDPSSQRPSRIPWLIGGIALVLLTVIISLLLQNQTASTPAVDSRQTSECPDFDTSGFRILLIPFQKLRGDDSRPELSIQERIRTLTKRNQVDTDVELLLGTRFAVSTPDDNAAAAVGTQCAADMVIWGQYESESGGIAVDVRYLFTKDPKSASGAIADQFKNLTELKSNRMKFTDLEQAVLSLCSVMAYHEGNTALAKKWMDKLSDPPEGMKKVQRAFEGG